MTVNLFLANRPFGYSKKDPNQRISLCILKSFLNAHNSHSNSTASQSNLSYKDISQYLLILPKRSINPYQNAERTGLIIKNAATFEGL